MDDDTRKYESFPINSTEGKRTINVYAKKLENAEPQPGDLLANRYQVLDELGRGGMGVVYRCFDTVAGVEVAVKALPQLLSNNKSEMEEVKDNFQLVSGLVHTNIAVAKTLERDPANGSYYLVMELVEGEELRRWMRTRRAATGGTLSLDDALPILRQVASALDYAHLRKIIHRDVKPANVMVCKDGLVKVMDFGIAAQVRTSLSRVSQEVYSTSGTAAYMAPEQWRGEPQGPAADQYALAAMAYEMLAGHLPFDAVEPAVLRQVVLNENVRPIDGLPATANRALKRALSKKATDRFPSCSEFVGALAGEKIRLSSSGSAYTMRLVIGVALVAVLAVAGVYVMRNIAQTEPLPQEQPTPVVENVHSEHDSATVAEGAAPSPQPKAAVEEPKESPEVLKQLEDEILPWRGRLARRLPSIESANYDGGQTFDVHLKSLKDSYYEAEGAMADTANKRRLHRAHPAFKKAVEELDWIEKNAPLRVEAQGLMNEVKSAREEAVGKNADTLAKGDFEAAGQHFAAAEKAYQAGEFQRAKEGLAKAKNGFGLAGEMAVNKKIGTHLASAQKALRERRWQDARSEASAIRRLSPDNADAATVMTDADKGEKREAVVRLLDALRDAFNKERNWTKAQALAKQIIDKGPGYVENEYAEAEHLKTRAEENARSDRQKMEKLLGEASSAYYGSELGTALEKVDAALVVDKGNAEANRLRTDILRKKAELTPNIGEGFSVTLPDDKRLPMLWVKPGSFTMGSPESEQGRRDDEKQHNVRLTKGYWLGKYEVTYGQWKALMGTDLKEQVRKALNDDTVYNISSGKKTLREFWGLERDSDPILRIGNEGDNLAMHYVSYDECVEFCRRLNERERRVGRLPEGYEYALPTEAQWEYACRAGTTTALYNGEIHIVGENNAPALDRIAWYGGNSSVGYEGRGVNTENWKEKQYSGGLAGVRDVVGKQPNAWGFYDMIGNVYEWCSDWYGQYEYSATDPRGPANGSYRVYRGGSWLADARYCRAALRFGVYPSYRSDDLGFRLALVPVQ